MLKLHLTAAVLFNCSQAKFVAIILVLRAFCDLLFEQFLTFKISSFVFKSVLKYISESKLNR